MVLTAASLLSIATGVYGAVTEKGEVRQPRNIYELIYAFEYTFPRLLKPEELKIFETRTPKEIQQIAPELYARISIDIKRWTDEWIQHIRSKEEPITEGRLQKANHLVERIESALKQYFDARGWTYRPMRVVFLPPKAFQDDRNRGKMTAGVFIPFYPDSFFATIDWPIPIELVLVHESLHYNAADRTFGAAMIEGVTDVGARHLARKYELMSPGEIRSVDTYPLEREGVEQILEKITERTGQSREEALDLLLAAYLTGSQDEMAKIFGKEAWGRVLRLSGSTGSWHASKIRKALDK